MLLLISFACMYSNCCMSIDSCLSSPFDSPALNDAYKLATIALAVIASIAIVIIILLVVYIVKKMPTNGLYIVLTDIRLRKVVIKKLHTSSR